MMLLPALIAISSYSDGSASIQVMAGARAFYSAIRPQVGTGVPDALHLKLLRPYISDRLADLLRAADEAEAKNAAQPVPEGEGNPPLFEGDIYSPYAEGFTSFKVLSAAPEGTVWVCKVQLTYVETGAEPMIWMDRATMVFEHGRWVVDNLDRLAPGETKSDSSLVSLLNGLVKEGQAIPSAKTSKP